MSNAIEPITPTTLDPSLLDLLIDEHQASTEPRLRKLWAYYRNTAAAGGAGQDARLAQTEGLPARLTSSDEFGRATQQPGREVVIENDIAWRINTIVSFMFGKPLTRAVVGMGAVDVPQTRDTTQRGPRPPAAPAP